MKIVRVPRNSRRPVMAMPWAVTKASVSSAAAVAGLGITRLPSMSCAAELASGTLTPILGNYEEEPIGVYAIYPSRVHLAPKVRAFVDFVADRCSRHQAGEGTVN